MVRQPLPIDPHLPRLVDALRASRAVVLVAAPGAGKTTRVPPALADAGAVIVLQPRRIAARTLARRVAEEQGWTVGREVGWHVRDDRRFSADTRVLFATEGILTARLQQDPLLTGFATIVLDEFHERSLHADLGLALARQAWLARGDLWLVVMSATIDTAPLAAFLDDCPVVNVPGALHPIEVRHRADTMIVQAVAEGLRDGTGDVLAFLPGAREIDDAQRALVAARVEAEVVPLHRGLSSDAQDAALRPGSARRVVLATNIAETSLTVPRVQVVVDAGLQKVARYDAGRRLDQLTTERITADAAEQRGGRAGRLGPGLVLRLWDERAVLRPFREPELHRVDLAPLVLAVLAWGSLDEVAWFEPPREDRLREAHRLLERLGMVDGHGRITPDGRDAQRLPLHPRLARLVMDCRFSPVACRAAAALAEMRVLRGDGLATDCDIWSLAHDARRLSPHIVRAAESLAARKARDAGRSARDTTDEEMFRRAVLAAWPDRVAQRRDASDGQRTVRLASGTGARLAPDSGVHAGWLVAVSVMDATGPDALVTLATGIERAWLEATHHDARLYVDDGGTVRAVERDMYDALVLRERHAAPDPSAAADALACAWLARPMPEDAAQLVARLAFGGLSVPLDDLARRAAAGRSKLSEISLADGLSGRDRQALRSRAPDHLRLPSGRSARLQYRETGDVVAAVKLQELFGLADSPRLGPHQQPVLFELLAPNGRPVQTTRDLRSFWTTTYQEVRKELRARYPKHPWPEDPWAATATHRTTRR